VDAQFYLDAFHALSTERQLGAMGGAGYIPWSKAMLFADLNHIASDDERDRFWRMLRVLDEEYLGWLAEKQKTSTTK
jgi:hypothetical protein